MKFRLSWVFVIKLLLFCTTTDSMVSSFLDDQSVSNCMQCLSIHDAANIGCVSCMRRLLLYDSSLITARGDFGYTPLHCAARYGDVRFLQFLADGGASINVLTDDGNTPLHISAAYGHWRCVWYLLEQNASVDTKNEEGETPLHAVIGSNNCTFSKFRCIELLLDAGADPNAVDASGDTPLGYIGDNDQKILITFLRHGADILMLDGLTFLVNLETEHKEPHERFFIFVSSIKKLFIQDMRRVQLPLPASLVCMLAKRQIGERNQTRGMLRVKLLQSYQQALSKILWRLKILLQDNSQQFFVDGNMYKILKSLPIEENQDAYINHPVVAKLINAWAQEASENKNLGG